MKQIRAKVAAIWVGGGSTKNMKKTRIFDSFFEQKRVNSRLFDPILDGIQLKVVSLGVAAPGFPPLRAIPMKPQ